MAEANTPAQNAADPAEPRTFTQEEVNTMCAREAGRTERALLKQLGLADKSGLADLLTQVQTAQSMGQSLQTVTGERDDYKQKYEDTLAGLNALKNTQTLASYGVTEADEQEFMAFKIGKLVTDKKDFAAAAKEYFEQHPVHKARVRLAADTGFSGQPASDNDAVNAALRRAAGYE